MASALGCGHNTQAMIITRSLTEMARFVNRIGADAITLLGLSGVGDLILTCTSDLSRNFRVGYAIAQGQSVENATGELGQVAEGVNTLKIIKHKADELDVYMPLVSGLYAVMFEQADISRVVKGLMTGDMATDVEFRTSKSGGGHE